MKLGMQGSDGETVGIAEIDKMARNIYSHFNKRREDFKTFRQELLNLFDDDKNTPPRNSIYTIKSRIKDRERFQEKITQKNSGKPDDDKINLNNYTSILTDILGLRFVCYTRIDTQSVKIFLESMYNQKKLVYMKPPEFKDIQESGYTAWHFFVKLPEDTAPENIRDLQAEIQVNTIFEDAWIELSHKHVYESKRSGKPIPEWVNKGFVALQAYTQAVQAHAAMLCRDMITIYINGYATIPMMQDNKDKQPRPG